jgi:hypothetical protein
MLFICTPSSDKIIERDSEFTVKSEISAHEGANVIRSSTSNPMGQGEIEMESGECKRFYDLLILMRSSPVELVRTQIVRVASSVDHTFESSTEKGYDFWE